LVKGSKKAAEGSFKRAEATSLSFKSQPLLIIRSTKKGEKSFLKSSEQMVLHSDILSDVIQQSLKPLAIFRPFMMYAGKSIGVLINSSKVFDGLSAEDERKTDAKFRSVDRGFIASVVGGGVSVDCCGGGVKDGNDSGMTVEYTGEESVITEIGTVRSVVV
nr:hypothetical protein [Tanacetum cinerariifolium]